MKIGLPAYLYSRFRYLLLLWLLALGVAPALASQGDDEVTPEVQELYAQAKAAQKWGDNATAIAKYQAMIKLAPHLAAAYNNLGMLYFDSHDYTRAAEVLQRGMELNPNMPSAAAMLGMSYFQLGNNEKAQPLLEAALRSNPKDDQVEMVLVHILINERKLPEASSRLNDYLARNPKSQEAWFLLG
jgi:tetratricopeptide (TPR) repeat protein